MKMLHVTVHTARFSEEVAFYQDIVGLKIVDDRRPSGRDMVFLADAEGDTSMEIIGDLAANDAGNAWLSVGFRSAGVEELRAELEKKGYAPTPIVAPNPHVKFFFVRDPAGVRVQFM